MVDYRDKEDRDQAKKSLDTCVSFVDLIVERLSITRKQIVLAGLSIKMRYGLCN